jgi:hypothetical protein
MLSISPVSAKNCRFSVDLPYGIVNNAMWHNLIGGLRWKTFEN